MAASGVKILGMGNPLLDISVEVPDLSLLSKYGLKMGDACLAGPQHDGLYAELVATYGDKVQYIAGGATQNSIRVAQWVLGEAGATAYVGCVGDDAYGATLAKCAGDDGVAALYQVAPAGTATGTCAVLVHEQERSLCANLAAAEALSAAHAATPAVAAALESASFVYNAGFPLTHAGGAEIAQAFGAACSASAGAKCYVTNLSAPFICQFFKDRLAAVIHHADYVFGNESEAAAWAGANGCEGATVEEVALKIAALPKASDARARIVVITQGAKETVWAEAGAIQTLAVKPVENIVDVNGAGDAFVGGFLAALAGGRKTTREAVQAGQWAAAHVIQRSGCTFDRTLKAPFAGMYDE